MSRMIKFRAWDDHNKVWCKCEDSMWTFDDVAKLTCDGDIETILITCPVCKGKRIIDELTGEPPK